MLKKKYDLAMIIVSHDFEFVREYADNVILLDKTIVKKENQMRFLLVKSSRRFLDRSFYGRDI